MSSLAPPHIPTGSSSVSLFNNAEHTHMQDTNISVTVGSNNITIANPKSGWDPIELLIQFCAFDALVDAKERFDPPKCAPETREAILQHIIRWITGGGSTPEFMWLSGSAGSGKSAVCQTLSETCKREGKLIANFFFSRVAGSSGRSNGDRLLPTLVHQIFERLPETRSHIKKAIRSNRSVFTSTRASQMETLVRSPLNQFSVRRLMREALGKKIRLIVIDGWDECQGTEVQCDLLRVLSDAASTMSVPLRILIASRPEAHITQTFNHYLPLKAATTYRINLDDDQDARIAISTFVRAQFHEILSTHPLREHLDPSWPPDAAIEFIVSKSSPQFIFASTAMKYIGFTEERPDERLNAIISMTGTETEEGDEAPFERLDKLYSFIFAGVKAKYQSAVWAILGVVYLAGRKEFETPTPSLLFFEQLFHQKPGMVNSMLAPLLSVISVPSDRKDPIRSLHASLFDFLLERQRSGKLVLDLLPAHSYLFGYYGQSSISSELLASPSHFMRILRHAIPLPATDEGKPLIDNLATAVFSNMPSWAFPRQPEVDIRPVGEAQEVVEVIFNVLERYTSDPKQGEDNLIWLNERLSFYEQLPAFSPPIQIRNPFTSPICKVKHCASVRLAQSCGFFNPMILWRLIKEQLTSPKDIPTFMHTVTAFCINLPQLDYQVAGHDQQAFVQGLGWLRSFGESLGGRGSNLTLTDELSRVCIQSVVYFYKSVYQRFSSNQHIIQAAESALEVWSRLEDRKAPLERAALIAPWPGSSRRPA